MHRGHIGEVNCLRVFGVVAVVLIHAYGFYLAMPVSGPVVRISQELIVNLLRFARYVFMFVTGVVLFYTYNGRKFNVGSFFHRRLKNLVIPYVVWTGIYLLIQHWSKMISWPNTAAFVVLWAQNILDGEGFYTLYYILVVIEFYLLFPLILGVFKPRRPRLAAVALITAGILFYALYHYVLEMHPTAVTALAGGSGVVTWFLAYKDRLIISYLPIYLLGGLAGLYVEAWRKWLSEHLVLVAAALLLGAGLVTGEYFYLYRHLGQSWYLTVSVFKPNIYLYSLGVIAMSFLLARVLERQKTIRPLIALLAANSLGIYLMHPAVEYLIHSYLWPHVLGLPGTLLVILDPALAIAVSCLISQLLGGNRYTRFIVGEAGNLPRKAWFGKGKSSGARPHLLAQ